MMDALVDWFGKDFRILRENENEFIISVKCNEQAMMFWAMQYGKYAFVLEPESLRDKIRENVEYMYRQYTGDELEERHNGS